MHREIKDEDQSRQFNATMMIAVVVAAVLALFMLGLIYGCMRANHAPELKPPATHAAALFSNLACTEVCRSGHFGQAFNFGNPTHVRYS